jgi:hypothetical protein
MVTLQETAPSESCSGLETKYSPEVMIQAHGDDRSWMMSNEHHADFHYPNLLQTTKHSKRELSYFSTKNSQLGTP